MPCNSHPNESRRIIIYSCSSLNFFFFCIVCFVLHLPSLFQIVASSFAHRKSVFISTRTLNLPKLSRKTNKNGHWLHRMFEENFAALCSLKEKIWMLRVQICNCLKAYKGSHASDLFPNDFSRSSTLQLLLNICSACYAAVLLI